MKPMIKVNRSGADVSDDDREMWLDPFQIASIVPDKYDGSIITLIQKNFFKVQERPREVIGKCVSAKRLKEETWGND